jgi:LMBR1-like membrane protein
MLIVVVVVLCFVFCDHSEQMMGVAIALANAWGLFVLITMMGYGLVQIPRKIWWASNREMQLKRYQFNVVSLSQKLDTYRVKYNTVRLVSVVVCSALLLFLVVLCVILK